MVAAQQRLGIDRVSPIAALRSVGRLPNETFLWYLETCHRPYLRTGAIVAAQQQAAPAGDAECQAGLAAIRTVAAAHGDEAGCRENGVNRYTGGFCTPTERFFTFDGRHQALVEAVLDETFSRALVSDFYAAPDHYPGLKPRC